MAKFPNIKYRVNYNAFPDISYIPNQGPCEVVSPLDYSWLSWFGAPLPDFSFAIEPAVTGGERKIDQAMAMLKNGVESIQNSTIFRQYLETLAKFHDYSIGNIMLIMLQSRNATRVAGFNTWRDLGRFVKAGEKGIMILAPCLPPKEVSCPLCGTSGLVEKSLREHVAGQHPGENVAAIVRTAKEGGLTGGAMYFKVVYVFDISQTGGKDLPQIEVPALSGAANETLFSQALELAQTQNVAVSFEARQAQDPEIKGMYSGMDIWVKGDEPRAQQLKTLLHELSHYYTERVFGIARVDAETIAESSAYVVASRFGFDTGTRSFPYVAIWSQDKKVLEKNLASIRSVSARIISGLEAITVEVSLLKESFPEWTNTHGAHGQWNTFVDGQPLRIDYIGYDFSGQHKYYRRTINYNSEMFAHQFYASLKEAQADSIRMLRAHLETRREQGYRPGQLKESEAKQPWQITRREFQRGYLQHTDLRSASEEEAIEKVRRIQLSGFESGYLNTIPPTEGLPNNVIDQQYGTRRGKITYAVPLEFTKNGKIVAGWKPKESEIVKVEYDYEPLHRAIVRRALSEGKPVPAEVLKDYPDLKPVSLLKESAIKTPYQYGIEAFGKGLKAIPLHDPDFMAAYPLKGSVGENTEYFKEWSQGWHEANAKSTEGPSLLKGSMPTDSVLDTQIRAAKSITDFPLWNFRGYRVNIENWGIPRGSTVADVIRFEVEELGNERHLSDEQLKLLEKYPAHSAIWVAKTKEAASDYLSEGMAKKDITVYNPSYFGEGTRIIDLDYQDGYLLLIGDAINPGMSKPPIEI